MFAALAAPEPALLRALRAVLPAERVLARPLDRLARSADASLYRLVPQAVVRPRQVEDVAALLDLARRHGRHLTFRAAGTSLSGQAVGDDLLVELAHDWKRFAVLDAGRRVWFQPGVVGGHLNRVLRPHARRIGPDPASIEAAMMGGILANNSSGMCCGVVHNAYHTLDSLRLLLPDGTEVDTSRADADARLRAVRPELHAGLLALRDELRADAPLCARLRRKFARKNTMGYSLQALLDRDAPADILARLMVGSQGTLGFVAEATLHTVPDPPRRATALLHFGELPAAGAAVAPLAEAGAAALEIMDAASLRSQAHDRVSAPALDDHGAALLVEFQADDDEALRAQVARAERLVATLRLLAPPVFDTDPARRDEHWRLRRGLFASVGARRPPGTAVVMEDVVVPVERLADAIADLQALFRAQGVPDTVVFGHAKDGNLHFVLALDTQDPRAVERYDGFMQALAELVLGRYDGALKAEHGAGRNMAPWVRAEWGDAAYALMTRVKRLLDPDGILNPGVLLNDDPRAHVTHLKRLPRVSPLIDACIECGFCEPRCPTRDVTLSPRQRIVAAREIAARGGDEGRALRAEFVDAGPGSCLGDSLCRTACPVKIDTGALMKEWKADARPAWAQALATLAATRFGATAALARTGLRVARALRPALPAAWRDLPPAAPGLPRPRALPGGTRAVYFPTCLTRVLGPRRGDAAVAQAMVDVLAHAGFEVVMPARVERLCCGLAFASQGYAAAARRSSQGALAALAALAQGGRDAVVLDASPCANFLAEAARERAPALRLFDFPAFWARAGLPRLRTAPRRVARAVLHPTCSLRVAGGLDDLLAVARACADEVVVPAAAECCGFAGAVGFTRPELTAAAAAAEAAEVRAGADGVWFSTCATCEIGMTRATGRPYRGLVHLVRETLPAAGDEA
jgi:D-lactate dehydrogenase